MNPIQIHQIPVLLGAGRRLFEVLPSPVELEIIQLCLRPPDPAALPTAWSGG